MVSLFVGVLINLDAALLKAITIAWGKTKYLRLSLIRVYAAGVSTHRHKKYNYFLYTNSHVFSISKNMLLN